MVIFVKTKNLCMILYFPEGIGSGLLIVGSIAALILLGILLVKVFIAGGAIAVGATGGIFSVVIQLVEEYVLNNRVRESDVIDYPKEKPIGVINLNGERLLETINASQFIADNFCDVISLLDKAEIHDYTDVFVKVSLFLDNSNLKKTFPIVNDYTEKGKFDIMTKNGEIRRKRIPLSVVKTLLVISFSDLYLSTSENPNLPQTKPISKSDTIFIVILVAVIVTGLLWLLL